VNTRIHSKLTTAIAAAAMIAAAVVPWASADSAKGTRVQIPPSLANFREPGSTGWLPQVKHVVIPPRLAHFREPGSTGWVPQGVSSQPSAGDLARGDALNKRYHLGIYSPAVQARPKPVDPLAVSYLMGMGLSPSQVSSWTVGACSHEAKTASCYAMFQSTTAPKIDPLAVGYLMGKGLSPSQVQSWTVGACSHRVKDASCYAMLPSQAASAQVVPSDGFQWADAGIGAGFTLGIVLILAGSGLLISRQNRRQQSVHA
jgi:hypothetical protein